MKKKKKDVNIGDKFNRWTLTDKLSNGNWIFTCDCGNTKTTYNVHSIINGNSKSCGCYRQKMLQENNPMYREDVKDKLREAYKKRIASGGIDTFPHEKAWSEEARKKRAATNRKRYGGDSPMASPKVRKKLEGTIRARYGTKTPAQCPDVVEKMKVTNIERYGVYNWMRVDENARSVGEKIRKTLEDRVTRLSNGEKLVDYCKAKGVLPTSARNVLRKYGQVALEHWLNKDTHYQSALEISFLRLLQSRGIHATHHNKQVPELTKDGIKYKPDIKVEQNGHIIYIDIDGLYYHSEINKPNKKYHMDKFTAFNERGIPYLQIRQDELVGDKSNIVVSIIASKLGLNHRVYARNLELREISNEEAREFTCKNHLMGPINGVRNLALCDANDPAILLSYKMRKDNSIELSRLVPRMGLTVVGGLSRLMKNAIIRHPSATSVISFVDCRYADGHSLTCLGFELISTTLGWHWTDGRVTYNRLYCRANMDDRKLSEREYSNEMHLYKIYDAGQRKYIKILNK